MNNTINQLPNGDFEVEHEPIEKTLWLDDERDPFDPAIQKKFGSKHFQNIVWAKTVEEAIKIINTENITHICFDNDLGPGKKEGLQLAHWIEEEALYYKRKVPSWTVHSQNPVARKLINYIMKIAKREYETPT